MLEPNNTVVIIFGGSNWPLIKSFPTDESFKNSAEKIRDCFCKVDFLGVPKKNILYLFDSEQKVPDIKKKMVSFFNPKNFADKPIHLFFYYVGHGDREKGKYFLFLQSSYTNRNRFKASDFSDVVKQVSDQGIKIGGCYIIIDACLSDAATPSLKSGFDKLDCETLLLCSSVETRQSVILGDLTLFTWALLRSLQTRRPDAWSFDRLLSQIKLEIKNRNDMQDDMQVIPSLAVIYDKGEPLLASQKLIFPPFPYPPQEDLEITVLKAVNEKGNGSWVGENCIVDTVHKSTSVEKKSIEGTINKLCNSNPPQLIIKYGMLSLAPAGTPRLALPNR